MLDNQLQVLRKSQQDLEQTLEGNEDVSELEKSFDDALAALTATQQEDDDARTLEKAKMQKKMHDKKMNMRDEDDDDDDDMDKSMENSGKDMRMAGGKMKMKSKMKKGDKDGCPHCGSYSGYDKAKKSQSDDDVDYEGLEKSVHDHLTLFEGKQSGVLDNIIKVQKAQSEFLVVQGDMLKSINSRLEQKENTPVPRKSKMSIIERFSKSRTANDLDESESVSNEEVEAFLQKSASDSTIPAAMISKIETRRARGIAYSEDMIGLIKSKV